MTRKTTFLIPGLLPAALASLVLAGCGGSPPPAAEAEKAAADQVAAAEQRAAEAEAAAKQAADELAAAKQAQLEAELAARQEDLDKREAGLAAKEAAAKKQAAKPATKPAAVASTAAAKPEPPPPPKPIIVPAGTTISARLVTPLSSKTNRRGDRIEATVIADVMVDGQRAIPTGATVSGTITDRVSGSKNIGATPLIGVTFDTLAPDADRAVAISSNFVQTGKSEGGQDAAKIAGGAVAGAVIGNQVSSGKGSIIGGVIGAAAGSAAAKNTGSEVEVPAGTVISLTLSNAVELKP